MLKRHHLYINLSCRELFVHNPFKKEDDEKKVKKNKTETGKEPATVDLKPKIDD